MVLRVNVLQPFHDNVPCELRNAFMKTLMKKTALTMMAFTVACFTLMGDAVAEKSEQTYVKTNVRNTAKSVFTVDEGRKHEITQQVGIGDMKGSNPDFRVKEEWTYTHSDTIDGTGTERGYFLDTHEDGSHTYGTFEGAIKQSSKPDGSWEVVWEGTYKYAGGSEKYKNIKGSGTYRGKSSSQDPGGREEGRETIEY